MDIKNKLREIAFANHMDYFGVGSVDRWANAPEGHKPNDLLPTAKSVIVMGIRIPEGAIESNNRAFEGLRHGIFSYMIFGYNKLNETLDEAATQIANRLESEGHQTFQTPSSIPRDEYGMMGVLSNRHAAVCAGLAELGWNGLAMTPEAGPRVRWVPVVTDLEIEPDPLYNGPTLCTKCMTCVNICPVQALSREESVEVTINGRSFPYSRLTRPRCRTGVTGLAKNTPGRLQAEIPKDVTKVEDWLEIAKTDNRWNQMERYAAMCGRCLTQCPVGRD